jgi:DNA-binding MarR family transcriptional regulator
MSTIAPPSRSHMSDGPTLEAPILAALRRIIRAIDLHSRDLLQHYGMTTPQIVTLREAVRLQPVTAGALAQAVHVSQATMTGILDRLERQGLVSRVRDTRDRRTVMVTATEEGLQFLNKAPSLMHDRFRTELSRLEDWEQSSMLAVLQRIANMMGAEDLTAAPLLTDGALPLASPDPMTPAETLDLAPPTNAPTADRPSSRRRRVARPKG